MDEIVKSEAPQERRVPVALLVRIGVVLVTIPLAALLLRGLNLHEVLATLRHADWRLVAIAVVLNLTINTGARVSRWSTLLVPLPRTGEGARWWELCSLLLASSAASNLLPARAGEALRTVQLRRRHGYTVGGLVAAQLLEKVIEGLSLGALAIPVALFGDVPSSLRVPLFVLAGVGMGGLITLMLLARNVRVAPDSSSVTPAVLAATEAASELRLRRIVKAVKRFLARLGEAMQLMRAWQVWSKTLWWALVSDLADASMVGLCMHAVGIALPVSSWISMLLAINVAIALPSTPAQVGVLEAGAVLALGAFGIPGSQALAFAVLYHAAHVIPTTAAGLVGLQRQWVPARERTA